MALVGIYPGWQTDDAAWRSGQRKDYGDAQPDRGVYNRKSVA